MDELDKGLQISLRGPERDAAVAAFRETLAQWRLAMPPAELLVLD